MSSFKSSENIQKKEWARQVKNYGGSVFGTEVTGGA